MIPINIHDEDPEYFVGVNYTRLHILSHILFRFQIRVIMFPCCLY